VRFFHSRLLREPFLPFLLQPRLFRLKFGFRHQVDLHHRVLFENDFAFGVEQEGLLPEFNRADWLAQLGKGGLQIVPEG
jgi:hypothetical protein